MLDAFGVCDGLDASGMQVVGLSISVSDAAAATGAATGYFSLSGSVGSTVAASLGRNPDTVQVSTVSLGRRLSTGLSVSVDLLPYGGFNDLPLYNLQSLLGVVTSPAFSVSQVTSADVAAVCGNNICEVGERPNVFTGVVGCAADCPYPVVECPVGPNGLQCSGVGSCLSSGGEGVCACWSSYGGDACDSCGEGFTNSTGGCLKLESTVFALPGKPLPIALIVGVSVASVVLVLVVVVVTTVILRKRQRAGKTIAPYVGSMPMPDVVAELAGEEAFPEAPAVAEVTPMAPESAVVSVKPALHGRISPVTVAPAIGSPTNIADIPQVEDIEEMDPDVV